MGNIKIIPRCSHLANYGHRSREEVWNELSKFYLMTFRLWTKCLKLLYPSSSWSLEFLPFVCICKGWLARSGSIPWKR